MRSMVKLDNWVAIAADYYQKETGKAANEEKCDFFRKTIENGLTIDEIMAAVDYAISVHGMAAIERDYWAAIQNECRRIWKEMKGARRL